MGGLDVQVHLRLTSGRALPFREGVFELEQNQALGISVDVYGKGHIRVHSGGECIQIDIGPLTLSLADGAEEELRTMLRGQVEPEDGS